MTDSSIWILTPVLALASCASLDPSLPTSQGAPPITLELEGGPLWQTRNDVRIPGDTGTRFALDDLAGDGPYPVARVTVDWDVDERHALRAVIAPLRFDGVGTLPQATTFAGQTFAAGVDTRGTYQFSSYRLGYRYTYLDRDHWRLRVGGTLFVRDAEIELEQGATRASDSDVGFVPLLNLAAEYEPVERWSFVAELDGLAAPQGRAVDFSLKGRYDLAERCFVSLGYRTIEGGADNDDVFSFAWLHAVVASIGIRL